ncbi:MAG TPA: exosortase/archaeosortase family protein [Opitutaceae bacterium]|jgi:exosortase C (VPDSG-CTERM-specific)
MSVPPRVVSAVAEGSGANPTVNLRLTILGVACAVLTALFWHPLQATAHLAWTNDLYSFLPLIPVVSAYLAWTCKSEWLGRIAFDSVAKLAVLLAAVVAAGYALASFTDSIPNNINSISFPLLLFWLLISLTIVSLTGGRAARRLCFPLCFLIFAVPLPGSWLGTCETFLQHGSATVAQGFFAATFTSFHRFGLIFNLPDIDIEVAPECSGLHSTLVLLITAVLAAHLFLRSRGRQALLLLAVLPLALIRNGFRIFVIGELCIWIGPDMINSYIHRHGGPIFFVLSLIPLFYWLRTLRRGDLRHARAASAPSQ